MFLCWAVISSIISEHELYFYFPQKDYFGTLYTSQSYKMCCFHKINRPVIIEGSKNVKWVENVDWFGIVNKQARGLGKIRIRILKSFEMQCMGLYCFEIWLMIKSVAFIWFKCRNVPGLVHVIFLHFIIWIQNIK